MQQFDLVRRLAAETIGTAVLITVVVGSGIMGESLADGNVAIALLGNTIATGAILVVLILSFGRGNMVHALQGDPQFDRTLTDWLRTKPYPVIDMRDVFARQYRTYRGDARSFLKPYYNGHHTPAGNFLSAWAVKSAVVEWLDPPPLPYR